MLSDRDKVILEGLLEGAIERHPPITLAVDTESLATVIRRQNDLIEKLVDSNDELRRGMALLAKILTDLQKQVSKPRESVSLTIRHADGKTSQVTG
jgi:hypothetical protein